MEYIISAAFILLLLILIVLCCEFFTNAVEHLGKFFNIGDGAVGSIFAAVGTALPETIVPLVAILGAYLTGSSISVGKEIGAGAILGSPFMLATLAMLVTGLAVLFACFKSKRTPELKIETSYFNRDLRFFLCAYTAAVFSSLLTNIILKYMTAILLICFYLFYAVRTIKRCCDGSECESDECAELYLSRFIKIKENLKIFFIFLQIVLAVSGLIYFSHLFVENIKFISQSLNISPLILSLFLAPIATELPEMFNSVIWVNKSKDTLALSNITGAMVFQSCIPMSIGIVLTPWVFTFEAMVNIIFVYAAVLILYFSTLKKNAVLTYKSLMFSGIFYIIYLIYVFKNL